jgi:tRNA-2-methylthio-N6-dimethylallyladenosine synthase
MTDDLIDAMAETSAVTAPYLHLPVQSGSSRVLSSMKRGYDREGYLRKIDRLRARVPGLCLGTDIIVGYPTESQSDFSETLSLLEEVQFDTCFSFAYSVRPGTFAESIRDEVPQDEKFERLARLQEFQKGIQERRAQRWVGTEVEVLVEDRSRRSEQEWTGRTPENRVVNFPGPSARGRLERLRIVRATAFSLRGERPAEPA